jgi:hypothetical protein
VTLSPLPLRNLGVLGSSNSAKVSPAETALPRIPASISVRCAFFASSRLWPWSDAGAGWFFGTM